MKKYFRERQKYLTQFSLALEENILQVVEGYMIMVNIVTNGFQKNI